MDENLLESKTNLTIGEIKNQLPKILRGTFILAEQYNFEENLAKNMLFTPWIFADKNDDGIKAFDRLVEIGSVANPKAPDTGFLTDFENIFAKSGLKDATGFANYFAFLEKLAERKNLEMHEYFAQQTEAILYSETGKKSVYEILKTHRPNWIPAILNAGK